MNHICGSFYFVLEWIAQSMNKVIIILIITLLFLGGIYYFLFSAPGGDVTQERFVVGLNMDKGELIAELKEQGFIRNEQVFEFVLKNQETITPGAYKISRNMDVWALADTFARQAWVVVPEGLRKEEVAEILQEQLYWKDETKQEFLDNAVEGYLFPNTYLFDMSNAGNAGEDIAQRMMNQFNEEAADLFTEAEEEDIRNDTLIVLASLVQREAANEEQMPIIAGVIWNRWLEDMNFGIDATVQYALGEEGDWWPKISSDDYGTDSPYNTYLYKGRPPVPICSPGLAAISAVIYPEESNYLYYLHDSEGEIHLAETYEEHLSNIEEYLK